MLRVAHCLEPLGHDNGAGVESGVWVGQFVKVGAAGLFPPPVPHVAGAHFLPFVLADEIAASIAMIADTLKASCCEERAPQAFDAGQSTSGTLSGLRKAGVNKCG